MCSWRQFSEEYEEMGLRHIVFKAIVSQTKPGAYPTISKALLHVTPNANVNNKQYIYIEHGTYHERLEIPPHLTNIVLIGDTRAKPIVQCNRHAPNFGTQETGTLSVRGDGFIAMNISFENTAGDVGQAAAAVVMANRVAFYKCDFHGHQDTLYAKSGIQFYKNCDIYGTVDFICGAAAAAFQDCNLYTVKRATNAPWYIEFTAQNRGSPASEPASGYVIQNCKLTVAPGLELQKTQFIAFLGRPWSKYSTVVVMESDLDSIIQPVGWDTWEGVPRKEVCYREYNNRGDGANKHRNIQNPEEVKMFTVGEFINKDGWLAGTLIPHYDGFRHHLLV